MLPICILSSSYVHKCLLEMRHASYSKLNYQPSCLLCFCPLSTRWFLVLVRNAVVAVSPLASYRGRPIGAASLNVSPGAALIRRIVLYCLRSTLTQNPAAEYMYGTCDQRLRGERGVTQDQDPHQNKGFSGSSVTTASLSVELRCSEVQVLADTCLWWLLAV